MARFQNCFEPLAPHEVSVTAIRMLDNTDLILVEITFAVRGAVLLKVNCYAAPTCVVG